jgi:hypothetical protein
VKKQNVPGLQFDRDLRAQQIRVFGNIGAQKLRFIQPLRIEFHAM